MSLIGEVSFLERLQYFDGQRLFASDLQEAEDFNRAMRQVHNEALHGEGVGIGLGVNGVKGAREVSIEPGYAIDSSGQEIILTQSKTLSLPPKAGTLNGEPVVYDLTISYPDERDLEVSETREGICLPRGAVRLIEQPVFCWVELGPAPDFQPVSPKLKADLDEGRKLRLARAEVLNCQLNRDLLEVQRRNARPQNIPYVACGDTIGQSWVVSGDLQTGLEFAQDVDTSAGGFRTEPCYIAHVVGDRAMTFAGVQFVLDGFTRVLNTSLDGFRLSLMIPAALLPGGVDPSPDELLALVNAQWHVEWIGVEG